MLLVAGGLDGAGDMLDSTEVLAPSSSSSSSAGWRVVAGLLPRAMYGVQVAALDNTLYCTGGDTVSRHHSTPRPPIHTILNHKKV